MNNNDVLRRLRYTFDLNDEQMIKLFSFGQQTVTRAQVSQWLKRDDNEDFKPLLHLMLNAFLDGLIIECRGPSERKIEPSEELSNNEILRKLRIALELREENMLEVMELGGMPLSRPELSALFRKPSHKHYRPCQDQLLRHFLRGLQEAYRPAAKEQATHQGSQEIADGTDNSDSADRPDNSDSADSADNSD